MKNQTMLMGNQTMHTENGTTLVTIFNTIHQSRYRVDLPVYGANKTFCNVSSPWIPRVSEIGAIIAFVIPTLFATIVTLHMIFKNKDFRYSTKITKRLKEEEGLSLPSCCVSCIEKKDAEENKGINEVELSAGEDAELKEAPEQINGIKATEKSLLVKIAGWKFLCSLYGKSGTFSMLA